MLFLLLFAAQAPAQAPPIDEILRKMVERAKWSETQKSERKYVWTRHLINDEYDSNGAVKKHVDVRTQIVPLNETIRAFRPLERDGKPVSEADRQAEYAKEQKLLAEGGYKSRPGNKKKSNNNEDEAPITAATVAKYNWKFINQETIDGRTSYQLSFAPKSKDLPIDKMQDRLLNKLAGKIWVDSQDFEIARADGHLVDEASMLGGLVGTVHHADFFFEQVRMDEGPWLPRKFAISMDGRIVLKTMRFKQMEEMSDFHRITPELIAASLKH